VTERVDRRLEVNYDVIIAGAGIAGCTAATLYGRAGLRVALIERSASPDAHKVVCGHFVLGGARDTLQRAGFWAPMIAEGAAVTHSVAVWTSAGWITQGPDAGVPPAISLRRIKLDPLLRRLAAGTPGVDVLRGHTVVDLLPGPGGHVAGIAATTPGGARCELGGRLVAGADGHHSAVARIAGVAPNTAPNERFLFWGYYRGARMTGPGDAQLWLLDPDAAVCCRTDDGLIQVGVFPAKTRLAEFAADRAGAFERFVAALPEGPRLDGATRVGKLVGTTDYPCLRRDPTPRPGLALVGDAATAGDPVPAVGCGWALRSAEWLVDATLPALTGVRDLGRALRQYRRQHRFIDRYDQLSRRDARALPPNLIQRAVRAAAVHDPELARRVGLFAMRAAPPTILVSPSVAVRAVLRSATT
jgi:2-polyprenyl-6-methoxyphenol hydroxylase-like FAD-dependent oxidoreductase